MEIVSTGQWLPGDRNAMEVEGKPHGAKVTVLLEHMPPGAGPRLHWHPYGETWVVVEGRIAFTDGKVTREAGPGDGRLCGARGAAQIHGSQRPAHQDDLHPPVGRVHHALARGGAGDGQAVGPHPHLNSSTPHRPIAPTKMRQ